MCVCSVIVTGALQNVFLDDEHVGNLVFEFVVGDLLRNATLNRNAGKCEVFFYIGYLF